MRASEQRADSRSRPPRTKKTIAAAPEAEPLAVVRKSPIQGRGVFATRTIKKGAKIIEYVGERISHEEAGARYDDETMRRHHTFLFAVDDELCIDGAHGGNEARYINHSCDPNAYAIIEKRRVFIRALRTIKAGEEILYDYWYTTDPSYTLEELQRVYPCRCGSPKCRGTLAAPPKKPRAKKSAKSGDKKKAELAADESAAAQ